MTGSAEHPITVEPNAGRVRVWFARHVVADTVQALVLREASLSPVLYVPRTDADMRVLERTAHATHCPYKGDASYFTINVAGGRTENAVWSYESPLPSVAPIKDHLAFYPDRVDRIENTPP